MVDKLKEGQNIALITDAGTPAISDPGEVLVKICHEEGIVVTSLPGPAACITALTMSGLPTRRFCFEGFLPDNKKERAEILETLSSEMRTMIVYEAPHHLVKTLKELYQTLGDRRITICRELTKKFETILPTTFKDALTMYESEDPRGEYVLVIEGKSKEEATIEKQQEFENISIEDHVKSYEEQGYDRKEAMKKAAKDRGITKREVYDYLVNNKK